MNEEKDEEVGREDEREKGRIRTEVEREGRVIDE